MLRREKKASVELSDALIHITVPLLVILSPLDFLLFLSPFCPNSGFWMLVDIKLGSCVVEQSFFENIRRFESHHSALGFTSSDLLSWECWTASSDLGTYKTIFLKDLLLIAGSGAVLWKKASLEISDALSHITAPLLRSSVFWFSCLMFLKFEMVVEGDRNRKSCGWLLYKLQSP